jgi:hypothetical protein
MAETTSVHENDVEMAGEITITVSAPRDCNAAADGRKIRDLHTQSQDLAVPWLVTFFVLLVMGIIFIFAILLSSLLPMGSPQNSHAG